MSKFLTVALLASATLSAGAAAAGVFSSHADQHGGIDYRGTPAASVLSTPSQQGAGSGFEAAAATMMTVVATSADVHVKPINQSKVLTTLPTGTQVSVEKMTATGWALVVVNGSAGYIDGTLLK